MANVAVVEIVLSVACSIDARFPQEINNPVKKLYTLSKPPFDKFIYNPVCLINYASAAQPTMI